MSTDTTSPANSFADDDEEVTFDETPVARPAASPNSAAGSAQQVAFKPRVRSRPCGIRPAYVSKVEIIEGRPTNDGTVPTNKLAIHLQIADAEFPASDANKPIVLRVAEDEDHKLAALAQVFGIGTTAEAFGDPAKLESIVHRHCRVFATTYNGDMQIPRFVPSWTKQTDNQQFFDHVTKTLGLDKAAYYALTNKGVFTGVLPEK